MKQGHRPEGKICRWHYCIKCGIIYLKNETTRKHIQKGCEADNDE